MDAWHEFYATAGGASAALVGLLFVGISIHLDAVVSRPDVRATARGAFQALIAILVVSLLVLVPGIAAPDLGWTLVGLGGAGLVAAAAEARGMFGADLLLGAERAARKLGFRFAGLALLLVVGILFLTGVGGAMLWLMAAVFALLGSSAQNAWGLLIDVAEAKRAAEQGGALAVEGPAPRPAGR
jgi:modulator of FtsH protease